jgi:hypothetical protein
MYHPIVKEQVIPGQLEGLQAIRNYSDDTFPCQALSPVHLAKFASTAPQFPPALWKFRVVWGPLSNGLATETIFGFF